MIVATAGHIDHGKTTLVRALTGVDTDRLPQEKARGISIDLGFAYWRPDGLDEDIGFVDVPGHERFVRNMLAGVCAIDFVLLVVAADDGVMPQTREHLQIVDLLSVQRGIVVLSKIDRATPQRCTEVTNQVRAALAGTGLADAEVWPVSAVQGTGLQALQQRLVQEARRAQDRAWEGRRLRFAIDRAFVVPGTGTVVTGAVFAGRVAMGQRLVVSPAGLPVRVRGLQAHGRAVDHVIAGQRCAINLAGVEVAQLRRGDWVLDPFLHAPTQHLDVRLRLAAGAAEPLNHWTPVHIHLGTTDVSGRVAMRRGEMLMPGGSARVRLIADQPLVAAHGDRIVLRDQSATRTLAGGVVIDPFAPPPRRSPATRQAELDALEADEPAQALQRLHAQGLAGVDLDLFARRFGLSSQALTTLLANEDWEILGKTAPLALPARVVEQLRARALGVLQDFHTRQAQALGMPVAELVRRAAAGLPGAHVERALQHLVQRRELVQAGSLLSLPGHVDTDNPADRQLWERTRVVLEQAGPAGIDLVGLARALSVRETVLEDFLVRKARGPQLYRVAPQVWVTHRTLAGVAVAARALAQSLPEGRFSAGQFRDAIGIGRARAVQLLECLDRIGITQRHDTVRSMRADPEPILGDPVR